MRCIDGQQVLVSYLRNRISSMIGFGKLNIRLGNFNKKKYPVKNRTRSIMSLNIQHIDYLQESFSY